MNERRKPQDRRLNDFESERKGKTSRRINPDRRLNSITVEWIPINHIYLHSVTRNVFNKH